MHFLSKAFTPAETNYTNIQQELLAILFACEKLYRICTKNHRADRSQAPAGQKPVSLAPPRLQRMLLHLSKCETQVKYLGPRVCYLLTLYLSSFNQEQPKRSLV